MTREEEIDYAAKHGIPVPTTKKKPLQHRRRTSGAAASRPASSRTPGSSRRPTSTRGRPIPQARRTQPQYVEIGFEQGIPVALDGKRLEPVDARPSG